SVSFGDMFEAILNDIMVRNASVSLISAKFHNTMAQVILDMSERIREEHSVDVVVLTGGVFQNKYLLERASEKLRKANFRVYTSNQVPANDGGISLGQMAVASKLSGLCA
ncbi:MAG TPA: hypothetical protein PKY14_00785, partial [Bacteroidales bacterium]|nr:hypothetical protein [Bacteroidales bacterium]